MKYKRDGENYESINYESVNYELRMKNGEWREELLAISYELLAN